MDGSKRLTLKRRRFEATPERAYRAARPILYDIWEKDRSVSWEDAIKRILDKIREDQLRMIASGLPEASFLHESCQSKLKSDWERWRDQS